MADYYAVLKRTLSGFSDPQPQLREKLYERARNTIERQLKGRVPPLDDATLAAELSKLDGAIVQIEQDYGSVQAAPVPQEPVVAPELPAEPPQAVAPEPVFEPAPPAQPEPPHQPAFVEAAPLAPEPPVPAPVAPEPLPEVFQQPVVEPAPEPVAPPAPPAPVFEPVADATSQLDFNPTPEQWEAAVQAASEPAAVAATPVAPPAPPQPEFTAPQARAPVDPAQELEAFLEQASTHGSSQAAAPVAQPAPPQAPVQPQFTDPVHDPLYAPAPAPQAAPVPAGAHDLPSFNETDDSLTIPPAPGYSPASQRPRRNLTPIILGVLGVAVLAGVGYAGYTNRDTLMSAVGLGGDDFAKPNPVKTITIKPEPASSEPEVQEPKIDDRLTGDGSDPQPATVPQIAPQLPSDDGTQTTLNTDTGDDGATAPSNAPVVAQKAFLYEEAGANGGNTADIGRVVWSVVQEAPATGLPPEPAIRARVEVPERGMVLIMTIKRNADQALPASHLIDLVFAVPDTFQGGNINEINRFVMKENEQGRGEQLVAVPARIADGIFLIALNNLAAAKEANETLLKSRGWIDIPVQYRTGRRALVTIEKGVPGDAVFEEVFAAWDAL